ncbi:hypothetical protein EC431_23790 [Salmonella enterica subsp. enterica serovar Braenderup]|uniref:Uncharacterized protein n=1 Tax=Salmonella enterica subsp. enterica serovar Braenderup TaxID=149391 RepID=A0A5X8N6Z7_SALET|nr:hypothetical protein [Salmonella enterica subsp. enterica serovar Typhimurium]EBH5755960.1 hypothetical protein [Salmonella enterica]EBZ5739169.1 hypothetical protein [Salmonella enterica subsp. enterica serovar Braenderup]EBR2837561.1 hypothetical protein [Salmonella enterica]EBU9008835.1 hypothetical protein [Salmonella enterica subsp. enterica serovar Typhimurium]
MENEQIAPVDFEGANRIYLADVLAEACSALPELSDLPVPSLDGDDAAVASLLHLMRQRDEMASAIGVLNFELGKLKDDAKAARARLSDAEARIAAARDALLAGNEPEPRDAMLALVVDQIRADLQTAEAAVAANGTELANLRTQVANAEAQIHLAVGELIATCRVARARALELALLNELRALAVSDAEQNRYNRAFVPAPELALLTSGYGQIEMLRPGRMPHLTKGVL